MKYVVAIFSVILFLSAGFLYLNRDDIVYYQTVDKQVENNNEASNELKYDYSYLKKKGGDPSEGLEIILTTGSSSVGSNLKSFKNTTPLNVVWDTIVGSQNTVSGVSGLNVKNELVNNEKDLFRAPILGGGGGSSIPNPKLSVVSGEVASDSKVLTTETPSSYATPTSTTYTPPATTSSTITTTTITTSSTWMPTLPSFVTGPVYYFDGTNGLDTNSGLSSTTPKKSITNNKLLPPGAVFLIKRGTEVILSVNLYTQDNYIGAYGVGSERGTIKIVAGACYSIGGNAGELSVQNLAIYGNSECQRIGASGIGATKVTKLEAVNNLISGYMNGIGFTGNNGTISNNIISNVTNNGILAGNDRLKTPAPSSYIIENNVIDGSLLGNDAITLHNGAEGITAGKNNIIRGNTITNVFGENAIDILGQYQNTIIENNYISGTGEYPITIDGVSHGYRGAENTIIRNNTIKNAQHAAIYLNGNNSIVEGNTISDIKSIRGAAAFLVGATGVTIRNNDITIPGGNARFLVVFLRKPGVGVPSGTFTNNILRDSSNVRFLGYGTDTGASTTTESDILEAWSIDTNTYKSSNVPGLNFLGGRSWDSWRSLKSPSGKRFDQHSTYSGL